MENMTMSDAPPGAHSPPQGGGLPQAIPQLPPQMFTTAAQLLDLTDKKLMVVLRDGRKLFGILRSWDQFANIVLQSTTERIFAPHPSKPPSSSSPSSSSAAAAAASGLPLGYYTDITHGIFLVRGENVLLLGEVDLDRDDEPPRGYELGEASAVKKLAEEKKAADKAREKQRVKKLARMGFEGENLGEIFI